LLWFRVKNLYVGSGVVTDRTTSLQMRLSRWCRRLCAFGNHYFEGREQWTPGGFPREPLLMSLELISPFHRLHICSIEVS